MKILLLAGEESGLIYANRLKSMMSGHDVRGYADYGFETSDLAVIGFAAVVRKLPYFIRVKNTMEQAMADWRPDVVCTIDYPGMNLKLAAFAKSLGIRTVHVVCPQVWAWKSGRIPKIEAALDRLVCFFPFEPEIFRPGFAVFSGHPLAEEFPPPVPPSGRDAGLVALLPGSRIGEIERNLPEMLAAAASLPGVRVEIPAANAGAKAAIESVVAQSGAAPGAKVLDGGARALLSRASCAVVASGTATLEAALAGCPTVLVYRVSAALAWFARRVIKGVRHIGLANIMWDKCGGGGETPMPELLQEDFTAPAVAAILRGWLSDPAARAEASARLAAVTARLSAGGDAYGRIVREILGS